MGAILINLQTGDPYLDENFNTVQVNDEDAFRQVIDGLFHCQVGTEPMHPLYGFDLQSALRDSNVYEKEMFIESLVVDALSTEKEKLISSVDMVKAKQDEQNPKQVNVQIVVTSILANAITLEQQIGG